eukprot:gene9789-63045_t
MQSFANDQLMWTPCEVAAESPEEMEAQFLKGDANRSTRATKMNAASSRSHLIFTIVVQRPDGREGRMALIDLAGSERLKKSEAEGQGAKEAKAINQSLFALGNPPLRV